MNEHRKQEASEDQINTIIKLLNETKLRAKTIYDLTALGLDPLKIQQSVCDYIKSECSIYRLHINIPLKDQNKFQFVLDVNKFIHIKITVTRDNNILIIDAHPHNTGYPPLPGNCKYKFAVK